MHILIWIIFYIQLTRVDGIHIHAVRGKLLRAGARHHIQRRLGHVGVRVVGRLQRIGEKNIRKLARFKPLQVNIRT